jgi:serine/threonine protein kinase
MSDIGAGSTLAAGRYRLERLLGSGGMASVWLTHDDQLGRQVAVKVLSDALAMDDSYRRRFAREARIAASLNHPNLVRVFDFSGPADRPYLVMEYVDGGTLAELLKRRSTAWSVEQLARELLNALQHVHAAGIVHRDVKPANVLIGRDGRARLSDFGIAQPEDATRLTRTGQLIGTLRFIAPEVVGGERADPRSDLYSLGVVLREAARARLSPALTRITEVLTAPDPGNRPASAAEALDLLDHLRSREADASAAASVPPANAVPATGAGRRDLHLTPPQWLAGLAALAIVTIAAIAVAVAGSSAGADAEPAPLRPLGRAPAPADAPLGQQLDALEREVRRLNRP